MVAALFGLPMLVGGAMIDPQPLNIPSLVTYWAIMVVILPFGCWPLFLVQIARPTAGRSRLAAVVNLWLAGPALGVAVIYWIYALLSYNPAGLRVDLMHRVIRYDPKTGIAVGLFGLCMLVSCGLWGVVASIARPQVTVAGAAITGCVLFAVIYGCGWLLVST